MSLLDFLFVITRGGGGCVFTETDFRHSTAKFKSGSNDAAAADGSPAYEETPGFSSVYQYSGPVIGWLVNTNICKNVNSTTT
jgi:hypothetical protein